jgi:hypothetical protein
LKIDSTNGRRASINYWEERVKAVSEEYTLETALSSSAFRLMMMTVINDVITSTLTADRNRLPVVIY